MSEYNKHYLQENYFGESYKEMLEFFDTLPRTKKVLDLGCGQGRDSISLGRMGFTVTGVDISSVGINQLNEICELEKLNVKGVVQDLDEVNNINDYDVIVLNSMFHFYKNDKVFETNRLNNILDSMSIDSIVVIVVQYSKSRVEYLKSIFSESENVLETVNETKLLYKEFNADFYMFAVQKLK